MRVTKTVKNYIEKRVCEKYKPLFAEVDLGYRVKKEEVNKKIESAVQEFEKQIQAIVADNCEKYNFEASSFKINAPYLDWCGVWDKQAEVEFRNKKRALECERNEKIENIIIELELGGDRETLERMLNEI